MTGVTMTSVTTCGGSRAQAVSLQWTVERIGSSLSVPCTPKLRLPADFILLG